MGNIYIAEFSGNRVRKISPEGVVTTLAGSGKAGCADGTGVEATFNTLEGITVDSKGDIYVTDSKNHKIRKITPDGVVTTIAGSGNAGGADGVGAVASFNAPIGVAMDSGSNIYVCDTDNHKIRKITPNGVVTTIAGTGKAGAEDGNSSVASFNRPLGITIDGIGNIYVAEEKNNKIRKITPNGFVSTLAGSGKAGAEDGYGTTASFNIPFGVAVDQFGTLYVADAQNNKIRKIYQY
jgi:sugar lactone lactonase YvrE